MISGVVLAAGASTRMGRPKQLLELGGRPMLQHVLDAAEAAPLDEVVVVLGPEGGAVWAALRPGPRTRAAVNPEAGAGQSTSLRLALRAVDAGSEAVVVLLGDQPTVRPQAVAAVVQAFRGGLGPVVRAAYGGRPGHPVLLARPAWEAAAAVEGDEGARGVLAAHPEWRSEVEVGGDPPPDVDTPGDYERIRAAFGDGYETKEDQE
ncbi:MAG: nucleotidyltransferase family protein [Actinobacteria bacterium]|nr:nucleotidyltransferase family protein [Actinomycetota bacterium]